MDTYEKKYKEALLKARDARQNTESAVTIGIIEEIFPELAESEDDRIRKELITFVKGSIQDEESEQRKAYLTWLEKQGEPTEINPSEFDLRLNKLLKQFESLPKEELISNLSYYLNVIQNDGTYKIEKQGEKSQRMISAEAKEAMYDKLTWSEDDEGICRAIINNIANDKSMCKFEISKRVCDAQINWLKSLKERIGG